MNLKTCTCASSSKTAKARSIFSQLLGCGADGYDDWPDWKPFASRPMGQREVWLGYDANGGSGNGDAGALSVTVPPLGLAAGFARLN